MRRPVAGSLLALGLVCAITLFLTIRAGAQGTYVPGPTSGTVASVFGRTGSVVAQNGDYNFSQIDGLMFFSQWAANGAASGQVPMWNGSAWVPTTITSGGGGVSAIFGRTGSVVATGGDYSFSLISGYLALSQIGQNSATTGQLLEWTGTAWAPYSLPAFVDEVTPTGTVNGSNATFSLASVPVTGSLKVYRNGIRMKGTSGTDYALSGSTITFVTAQIPQTGDVLLADYRH
jgi:hypothetical protein